MRVERQAALVLGLHLVSLLGTIWLTLWVPFAWGALILVSIKAICKRVYAALVEFRDRGCAKQKLCPLFCETYLLTVCSQDPFTGTVNMSKLLRFAIVLILWTIQGSEGRVISEPTQRLYVPSHDRPPAQTNMMEIPLPQHAVKRQITSSSNDVVTVTIAPDETCGWLSGRPGVPITCENHQPCMWMSSIALICGPLEDYNKWEYHLRCYEREEALNPDVCDDVCVSGNNLRW
jgi:hypothetical protein